MYRHAMLVVLLNALIIATSPVLTWSKAPAAGDAVSATTPTAPASTLEPTRSQSTSTPSPVRRRRVAVSLPALAAEMFSTSGASSEAAHTRHHAAVQHPINATVAVTAASASAITVLDKKDLTQVAWDEPIVLT